MYVAKLGDGAVPLYLGDYRSGGHNSVSRIGPVLGDYPRLAGQQFLKLSCEAGRVGVGRIDEHILRVQRVDYLGHVARLEEIETPILLAGPHILVDLRRLSAGEVDCSAELDYLFVQGIALYRRERLRVLDSEFLELLQGMFFDRDSGYDEGSYYGTFRGADLTSRSLPASSTPPTSFILRSPGFPPFAHQLEFAVRRG